MIWAEKNSGFTIEFEETVAENFDISWDEVDGIMRREVKRGLARRKKTEPMSIGIDETSFQKRHEYVTVILDKDNDTVIDTLNNRKAKTLGNWFKTQNKSDFSSLKSISMDIWDPFINAVKGNFKNADKLIAFDRFHAASHFGKALDKVRTEEHRAFLSTKGSSPLNVLSISGSRTQI